MALHYVATVDEIPVGARKIVQINQLSIGIFNVKGTYRALLNYCPHNGAELCKGRIHGTNLESDVYEFIYGKDQEIIRCPWHGWEFDMITGESMFDDRVKAKTYEVRVVDGRIAVVIGKKGEDDQHVESSVESTAQSD